MVWKNGGKATFVVREWLVFAIEEERPKVFFRNLVMLLAKMLYGCGEHG